MSVLRRLLSILLLVMLGLPLAAPLLAASPDDSTLPACCRRHGLHHCMGGMQTDGRSDSQAHFTAPREQCPYSAVLRAASHHEHAGGLASSAWLHHSPVADAVAARSSSDHRSVLAGEAQQRGPPSI